MTWNTLKLGNGGIVTNFAIHADGTRAITTDSFGSYVWSTSLDRWVQLLNVRTMPSSAKPWEGNGGDAIAFDPQNSNNIWMLWSLRLWKSSDKGATFTQVSSFPTQYASPCSGSPSKAFGPYLAIDPNNGDVVYVSSTSRGLYFTNDGGTTWATVPSVAAGLIGYINNTPSPPTSGTDSTSRSVGTGSKTFSNNSSAFGLPVGAGNFVQVYRTSDHTVQMIGPVTASSGTSFTINVDTAQGAGTFSDWTVSALTQAAYQIGGGHRIVFDMSGGTTTVSGQTRTKNVFVHTYGIGLYKSINGGVAWTLQNSANMPSSVRRMCCDPFGVLWVLDDDYIFDTSGNRRKYDGSTWTRINTGGSSIWDTSVAVDPTHVSSKATVRVCFVAGDRQYIALSNDGGATWNNSGGVGNRTFVSSGDVGWLLTYYQTLESGSGGFFANCDAAFDPLVSGKLWTGAEGVWYLFPPSSGVAITLTQQTRGIEQFIGNNIMTMPGDGGGVLMGTWDFPAFYSNALNVYPSAIAGVIGPSQPGLLRGYSFDYDWNAPNKVVGVMQSGDSLYDYSGKSSTYGRPGTWSALTLPAEINNYGGQIASAGDNTYVYIGNQNAHLPKETTNGGTTWSTISIPGGTPSQFWGAIGPYATACKAIESDKGNGDIYIYDVNDGAGHSPIFKRAKATGLWSTATANANFSGESNFNEQMTSTGVTGDMFFTGGFGAYDGPSQQPDTNKLLYFTNDGWATKATVPNFVEVHCIGVGKAFGVHPYPGICLFGWYNGVAGVWECRNWDPANVATGTWTQLIDSGDGGYPLGLFSTPVRIDGDKETSGIWYMITTASGGAYWSSGAAPLVHFRYKRV